MSIQTEGAGWIKDGEKFALLGLAVRLDPSLDCLNLTGGKAALPNAAFAMPDHWREWLGTSRLEDMEECSLFLLAKRPSAAPRVLDAENQALKRRVGDWFMGLMLTTKFVADNDPYLASGSRENGEVDVRDFQVLHPPARSIVDKYPAISEEDLTNAASIGERLGTFTGPWQAVHWRLLRCLAIYQDARCDHDMLNRIHQFTRCIEGLILPEPGKTKKQFKLRTELFVGAGHSPLMGELYDARSCFEHLHENRYLETFDRRTRIRLAELEAISEWIARSCLSRILLNPALITHFGSAGALARFWGMPDRDRSVIWGAPIDPLTPISGFRFDYVSNAELGARP